MVKTILKLYPNGDFKTIGTTLVQSGITNNYSFTENAITVPKVIEYPPLEKRNYFIEKTSISGYIEHHNNTGQLHSPSNEGERVSDYIAVDGWDSVTVRFHFYNFNSGFQPWISIQTFGSNKAYIDAPIRDSYGPTSGDYYMFEETLNINFGFIRVSANYYDISDTTVKISVEKGDVTNPKHYLAFEDMPEWVKDTGNPISIFPQGIVIKGDLVQTNS